MPFATAPPPIPHFNELTEFYRAVGFVQTPVFSDFDLLDFAVSMDVGVTFMPPFRKDWYQMVFKLNPAKPVWLNDTAHAPSQPVLLTTVGLRHLCSVPISGTFTALWRTNQPFFMAVHLNTIGIVVHDMGASLAFYRTLGLPVPDGQEAEANVEVTLPNGITLGFLAEAMARQADDTFQTPVGQRLNLRFACADAAEVDAIHARLDAYWDQRFARIIDPNGLIVNLFA
jgi:catechol 2,3-dioxygenase-like lactoylglutathione lyase family enzyme